MTLALTSVRLFQKTIGEFESIFGRMLYLPGGAVDFHKQCLAGNRVGSLRTVSRCFVPSRWNCLGEHQNGRELLEEVSGLSVKKAGLTT